MPFNVEEFRKNALPTGGARPALFQCNLAISNPGVTGFDTNASGKFSYACTSVVIPASTVGVIDQKYFGRSVKIPGDRSYDNISTTVLNDEEFVIRNALENWLANLARHDAAKSSYQLDQLNYSSTLTIDQYGKSGDVIQSYFVYNCFPVSISEITLDWNTTDTIETFTVEWGYDYWSHAQAQNTVPGL